jgi:hypothetical protein
LINNATEPDRDTGTPTCVLVVSSFVDILEATPSTDVIHDNRLEVGVAGLDVTNQSAEASAALDVEATPAVIHILPNDFHCIVARILGNRGALVLG